MDCLRDTILYYLCGYLLHARPAVTDCKECYRSVRCNESELPSDFKHASNTKLMYRGNLVYVTSQFFKTFRVVEAVIETHLMQIGQIYLHDSFQECFSKIAESYIIPVFFDTHRDYHLPDIIRELAVIRSHFESKRLKDKLLSKSATLVKKNCRLSKLV